MRGKNCEKVTVSRGIMKEESSGKWKVPLGGRRCLQNHDKRWGCHMWRQKGKNEFTNIWKKGAEEPECCSKVRRKPRATVSYSE